MAAHAWRGKILTLLALCMPSTRMHNHVKNASHRKSPTARTREPLQSLPVFKSASSEFLRALPSSRFSRTPGGLELVKQWAPAHTTTTRFASRTWQPHGRHAGRPQQSSMPALATPFAPVSWPGPVLSPPRRRPTVPSILHQSRRESSIPSRVHRTWSRDGNPRHLVTSFLATLHGLKQPPARRCAAEPP